MKGEIFVLKSTLYIFTHAIGVIAEDYLEPGDVLICTGHDIYDDHDQVNMLSVLTKNGLMWVAEYQLIDALRL